MNRAVHIHDKERNIVFVLCNTHQLNKPWDWRDLKGYFNWVPSCSVQRDIRSVPQQSNYYNNCM